MNPETVRTYRCTECKKEKEERLYTVVYRCSCGGNLEIVPDYEKIRKHFTLDYLKKNSDFSLSRYLPLLPVKEFSNFNEIRFGYTNLIRLKKTGAEFGLPNLFLKDDSKTPSASFKDRASLVALQRCKELGFNLITGASTGNAASSTSCLATAYEIKPVIFVPATTPPGKLAQLKIFGATVLKVKGNYDAAYELSLKVSDKYGWYNRNTGYNPYTREGKKTVSLEIFEQLGFRAPDKVFVPVGDGNIITGVYRGFYDLLRLGLIEKCPRLISVQSSGSNAINRAITSKTKVEAIQSSTLADSISVDLPRDGFFAKECVERSEGFPVTVGDEEILAAMKLLASKSGIFGEPAGVTAFAGFLKAIRENLVESKETIVLLMTGNGLKDINAVSRIPSSCAEIAPELGEFDKLLKSGGLYVKE